MMRNIGLFLTVIAALPLLFSCDPPKDPPQPEFKATVDGTPFTSSSFTASKINGRLEIEAIGKDSSTILIILPADTVRTYNLSDSKIVLAYRPKNGNWHTSQFIPGNTGNIIIAEKDTNKMEIRGTFFGSVAPAVPAAVSVDISGGSFQVLKVNSLPAPSINNRFSYKIAADTVASSTVTTTAPGTNNILTVLSNFGTKSMSFSIKKDFLGRYNLPEGNNDITLFYGDVPNIYGVTAGRFVIMRNDPIARRMTALFQMSLDNLQTTETKEVRYGFFDVKY